ncbi:MAG: PHP domain-containing protein [Firmicutes bacterium]|nr:PHP domain-containing protein [Bacillota bacterium]
MINSHGKIDLHMHSAVSDGTDTPAEFLAQVKRAGLGLFSLTDHDAVKGGKAILGMLSPGDPCFIPGVEFSCKDGEGKYHILGYGFDPDEAEIRRLVDHGHQLRLKKIGARLDYLKTTFGVDFPQEALDWLMALDNPGKPHIANLMVKYGYAGTKEDAIRLYINQLRFKSEYLSPEEAICGVLAAGGIPVLAHPCYGSGDQLILGEDMDQRIRRLMGFGLQGLEAFYSGFTDKLRREILDFAERYGLYITAGSDYHGDNKMIEIGDTGLEEVSDWPEGLRRFVKDATHGEQVEI